MSVKTFPVMKRSLSSNVRNLYTNKVSARTVKTHICNSPHLHLHRFFDPRRNVNVFDFITEASDSPLIRSLIDGVDNVGIEGLSFLKKKKSVIIESVVTRIWRNMRDCCSLLP